MRGIFLVMLIVASSWASAAGLPIGVVGLTLGMDQQAVLKKLKAEYTLIPVTGMPDLIFVSDKASRGDVIGSVAFRAGKLTTIERIWGYFDEHSNPLEVTRTLYAALESSTSVAGAYASVDVSTRRIPGTEYQSIKFMFAGRSVVLGSSDGKSETSVRQVSVAESVFEKQ